MGVDAPNRSRTWLRALYVLPIVSAVSLGILLLGDLIAAIEAGEHGADEDGGLHHLFVFDLAWPVFLFSAPATLMSGVAALVGSRLAPSVGFGRYAAWALGYVALALPLLLLIGALEL
jgi:hypothetical protein